MLLFLQSTVISHLGILLIQHAPLMVCGYIFYPDFPWWNRNYGSESVTTRAQVSLSYTPPLYLLPKTIDIAYVMPATRPDEAAYQCPSYTYLTIPICFNQSGLHPTYRRHVQYHFTTSTLRIMLPQILEYWRGYSTDLHAGGCKAAILAKPPTYILWIM